MIELNLSVIEKVVKGQLHGNDVMIHNISIDSRIITKDCLFIAIEGKRYDGHDFIPLAIDSGAQAVLTHRPLEIDVPYIVVENTVIALGLIAQYVKQVVQPFTVAITGSYGKTSVKEMTASIFSLLDNTLYTAGNFNNDIGVPLTLLRLNKTHRYCILEFGANHLGEIDYTTSLVRPDIAMITHIGHAHLEGFGSLNNVYLAKSEIFNYISDQHCVVINLDDDYVDKIMSAVLSKTQNVLTYSCHNCRADLYVINDEQYAPLYYRFTFCYLKKKYTIRLNVLGRHQINNALATIAIALSASISMGNIIKGIERVGYIAQRMQLFHVNEQLTVIDDTYNATLESTKAAIDSLSVLPQMRVFIFGGFAELGEMNKALYQEIEEYAYAMNIDIFAVVHIDDGFIQLKEYTRSFSSKKLLCVFLNELYRQYDQLNVLVKGARSKNMETVIRYLTQSLVEI